MTHQQDKASFFYWRIPENTILHFLLQHWAPGIISFLIGGILVSILMPYIQADFENERLYQKRRLEISEKTAEDFAPYITNWRRLRDIAKLEKDNKLNSQAKKRKDRYVKDRDKARDQLYATLERTRIYFSQDVVDAMNKFKKWDRAKSNLYLSELPSMVQWEEQRDAIITAMIKEVKPHD